MPRTINPIYPNPEKDTRNLSMNPVNVDQYPYQQLPVPSQSRQSPETFDGQNMEWGDYLELIYLCG